MRLIEPMDAKSAISVLNMAVTYNGCGRATSDDLAEALKMTREALEKQIPTRPTVSYHKYIDADTNKEGSYWRIISSELRAFVFMVKGEKKMKVYKNPFVSRESYFVRTAPARSAKMEASKSQGYSIDFWNGKWEVRKAEYYDHSLKNEMPVIAEDSVSVDIVIKSAILKAVLDLVCMTKLLEETKERKE